MDEIPYEKLPEGFPGGIAVKNLPPVQKMQEA